MTYVCKQTSSVRQCANIVPLVVNLHTLSEAMPTKDVLPSRKKTTPTHCSDRECAATEVNVSKSPDGGNSGNKARMATPE